MRGIRPVATPPPTRARNPLPSARFRRLVLGRRRRQPPWSRPVNRSRAPLVTALGAAILLLGTRCPSSARAEDAVAAAPGPIEIPNAWVEIATIEHSRVNAAGLSRFVDPDGDGLTRRRAIRANGRIGKW